MKNTTLIRILWITCVLAFTIVIGVYFLNFAEFGLSKNTENWGQFGDYIGGLLNPIISIINLIILTYLSIKLVKIENNRNVWTIKELARPYGEFSFVKNEGDINDQNYLTMYKKVMEILRTCSIKIKYSDIYNREIGTIIESKINQ